LPDEHFVAQLPSTCILAIRNGVTFRLAVTIRTALCARQIPDRFGVRWHAQPLSDFYAPMILIVSAFAAGSDNNGCLMEFVLLYVYSFR
jgi:hypothetical protein